MSLAEQRDAAGAGAGGEEGGGASAEEEEPAFETIWDSPCIEKYKNDQGKPTWRCLHCGFVKAHYNASKALAHVIGERSRSSRMVSAAIYLQRLQRCSRQSMETTAR